MEKLLPLLVRLLGVVAFGLMFLWLVGAAWFSELGPAPIPQVLAVVLLIGVPVLWFRSSDRKRVIWGFVGLSVLVIGLWQLKQPRLDRDWTADMQRPARVQIEGNTATLRDVRDFRYRSTSDYDKRYRDLVVDLDRVTSVDFLVERFHAFEGLAHTLLSFGFSDGTYLSISVEIRREQGESFHPVAGFFRRYELMYVVGTEQDLIGLRTNYRKSTVWLFPMKSTLARKRALLKGMLSRADALQVEPEFYNALTSTCTTNIVDHVRELIPGRIPFDWRLILPGYTGKLAHELGLIDADGSFDDAERRFRIDELAQQADVDATFSARIRSRREETGTK